MRMKLVLVDRDAKLRRELWGMLSLYSVFHLAAELNTIPEALDFVETHGADVIFVNYDLGGPSKSSPGPYLSSILEMTSPNVQTVVYSDSKDPAYESYVCRCAGFLLLPFDFRDIQMVVKRLTYIHDLQQAKQELTNRSIMVRSNTGYQMVRVQSILFVEHTRRSNRIITEDGKAIPLLGYTIGKLDEMLSADGFFRCHQSFMVNLSKVASIQTDSSARRYMICFENVGLEVPLSRDKYSDIVSLLQNRYAKVII